MEAIKPQVESLQQTISNLLPKPESDAVCESCNGTGWELVPGKGVRDCACKLRHEADKRAQQTLANARVPLIYRNFRLETLQPNPARHDKQEKVIQVLRDNPFRQKFFLHGRKKGAGKTTFGWVLLIHSALAGLPVYGFVTETLVDELRRFELHGERPRLLPSDLEIEPRYPHLPTGTLWLDEFDKVNVTEFVSRKIQLLLDTAVNWNWQIILASNLNLEEIQTAWSKHSDIYGKAIGRRAIEGTFPIDLS